MRLLLLVLFIGFNVAWAEQPSRPLTTEETSVLERQIGLGRRVVAALAQYSKTAYETNPESPNMWSRGMSELGLLTRTPTIDVLHAAGYISDSDYTLARRYRATPQPIPANETMPRSLLTMQSNRGELVFDTRGAVTLHPR